MSENKQNDNTEQLRFELECPFCENEIVLQQAEDNAYHIEGASYAGKAGALITCLKCGEEQALDLGVYLRMLESAGIPVLEDTTLWIKAGYTYYQETGLGINLREGNCPDCLSPITEVEVVGGFVYEGAYVVKEDENDIVIGCEKCKLEGSDDVFGLEQVEFEEAENE